MRLVILQFQVFEPEIEQSVEAFEISGVRELKSRKFQRFARKQLIHLIHVVRVNVQISERVDEIADLEAADMSDQMR